MSNNLKFSIVIPSYNQGKFIENTLKSILSQEYKNYEIIIIDGGSSDMTIEVIKKYSEHIKYWISEPDNGQSDGIIKGFKQANGDVLSWLNSDDIYMKDCLITVNDIFKKKKVDVVYGNKWIIDDNGNYITYRLLTPFLPNFLRNAYLCGGFGIYQPAAFWTREIYDKSGGIDIKLKFCMDNDLFNKFIVLSAKFQFVDKFLAGFRIHQTSKTSTLRSFADTERHELYKKYVVNNDIKFPKLKRLAARLYRLGWLLSKGKIFKMIYVRFIDRLKWVP